MYLKRNIEEKILKLSKQFKVLLITGQRQIGKTTMLKEIKENNRNYVSLDELEVRELAKTDPKLFLQKYEAPLIIDEIQYAPELFPYIKSIVDESDKKGQYWLTGSQKFELMKGVSESLAGRVAIIDMFPLSMLEKKQKKPHLFFPNQLKKEEKITVLEVFKEIFYGGMPEYYLNKIDRDTFFEGYIRTYLERDVRELEQVGDLLSFRKFLISVASRTGEVLNYSSIAEDAEVSVNTVKRWLSILVSTGLVYLLEPYHNLELKRAIKAPKIYFLDTGLCAYLCKWSSPEVLEASSVSGHYFETFVVSELVKTYQSMNANVGMYYYRDKDKNEIDVVLYKDDTLYPIEIKKGANPKVEMIKNFHLLENTKKKIGEGGIICLYPDILPLDEKNNVIPISCLF